MLDDDSERLGDAAEAVVHLDLSIVRGSHVFMKSGLFVKRTDASLAAKTRISTIEDTESYFWTSSSTEISGGGSSSSERISGGEGP